MKVAFFTNIESCKAYWMERVASEERALSLRTEEYRKALNGVGKDAWLDYNHIPVDCRESEWADHLKWFSDSVKVQRSRLRKAKREFAKAAAACSPSR